MCELAFSVFENGSCGGRSVGMVRSRTKATEFSLVFSCVYVWKSRNRSMAGRKKGGRGGIKGRIDGMKEREGGSEGRRESMKEGGKEEEWEGRKTGGKEGGNE